MKELGPYISYLLENKVNEVDAKKMLDEDKSGLTKDEKDIIFRYTYPRLLGDYELPSRIMGERRKRKQIIGFLQPDLQETSLILEAARTPQYSRFIKHLYHAFSDPSKISSVSGVEKNDCPICGKTILDLQVWQDMSDMFEKEEQEMQQRLAFSSTETEIRLCKNCLIQLLNSMDIMKKLDPGFLHNWN